MDEKAYNTGGIEVVLSGRERRGAGRCAPKGYRASIPASAPGVTSWRRRAPRAAPVSREAETAHGARA